MQGRIIFCAIIAIGCMSLSGCDKGDFDKKFTISMERGFAMQAGLNTFDAHYFVIRELQTNYAQIISQHTIPDGATVSIVPERAYIISQLGGVDFDFVNKVSLRIFTNTNDVDKPEAFYVEFVPTTVDDVLELIPTSFDAAPFLKPGLVNVEMRFFFKTSTPQHMDLVLRMDFRGNY